MGLLTSERSLREPREKVTKPPTLQELMLQGRVAQSTVREGAASWRFLPPLSVEQGYSAVHRREEKRYATALAAPRASRGSAASASTSTSSLKRGERPKRFSKHGSGVAARALDMFQMTDAEADEGLRLEARHRALDRRMHEHSRATEVLVATRKQSLEEINTWGLGVRTAPKFDSDEAIERALRADSGELQEMADKHVRMFV